MNICPCIKCRNRYLACHNTCAKFKYYKVELDKSKTELKQDREAQSHFRAIKQRNKKRSKSRRF